jgi:hypothetical protein
MYGSSAHLTEVYSPKCREEAFSEVRIPDAGCAELESSARPENLPVSAPVSRHLATSMDSYSPSCMAYSNQYQ